jgi:mono/diheme cytochrome c family protein
MRFTTYASLLRRAFLTFLSISVLSISASAEVSAEAGKKLFKANCASCHKLDKKLVGPALGDVTQRRSEEWLLKWIRNNAEFRASGDKDANAIFEEYGGSVMQAFPALTDDDIKSILAYTVEGDKKAAPAPGADAAAAAAAPAESASSPWLMYVLGGFLLINLVLLLRVRNTLKQLNGENPTSLLEDLDIVTKILVANKRFMTFLTVVLALGFLYATYSYLMGIGVEQNYQPVQPIAFSHKIHAGDNGVDCNYCHSSARHSKHSGIPSANVCMNCHMYIDGSEIVDAAGNLKYGGERSPEIQKIYAAIGWDPEARTYIEGYEQKPIQWIRIHNLPDLAYFNHAQHVTAGQVECQTCHGPVQEMEEVYQFSELTMGWCINCHRETEIKGDNGYYAGSIDGSASISDRLVERFHSEKITAASIGGLECGKCHY